MAADKSSHGDGPVAYLVHRPPDDAISGLSYPDTAPARAAGLIMKLEAEDYLEILVSS